MDTTSFDNDVRVAIYRLFVEKGSAPVAAELADAVSASQVAVEEALQRLHDGHVIVLAPGTPYIWMANPLSALPTPYVSEVGGRRFWGNCIWDALGIVAMLGPDGTVTAPCPDCGDELRLDIAGGRLATTDLLVHYAVPAAQWWDDIGFN